MNVFIIATQTADGYIARGSDHLATTWTTRTDKILFTRLTKKAGVIIMGWNTYATFAKALPGRRIIVYTHQQHEVPEGVELTTEAPAKLLHRLEQAGVEGVAICGGFQIYNQFMQTGLVTEYYFTIQPVFFGQGMRLFDLPLDTKLQLVDSAISAEDSTVTLHYRHAANA